MPCPVSTLCSVYTEFGLCPECPDPSTVMMNPSLSCDTCDSINRKCVPKNPCRKKYNSKTASCVPQNPCRPNWDGTECVPLCQERASSACQPGQQCNLLWDWAAEEPMGWCKTTSGGDGRCPDETASFSTLPPITYNPLEKEDPKASIGLLFNGFVYQMLKVLDSFHEGVRFVYPNNISPVLLEEMPVLLIPSGGLAGLSNSPSFIATLAEYVNRGGVVVALTQPEGRDLASLPGAPQGKGWTEDQSCFTRGAYIEKWHQILSGQGSFTPTLSLDGSVAILPQGAEVPLRRTRDGMGVLATYPYGQGKVILSVAYTDQAYYFGGGSKEERDLLRDILTWSRLPARLPEGRPGDVVSYTLEINNPLTLSSPLQGEGYGMTATSALIEILDPDRAGIKLSQTVSVSLPMSTSTTIPMVYQSSSTDPLGIWHTRYTLYDALGNVILTEQEALSGRFALNKPPEETKEREGLTFTMTKDKDVYPIWSDAIFTITIGNSSSSSRNIVMSPFIVGGYIYGDTQVIVPPLSSVNFTFTGVVSWSGYFVADLTELIGDQCNPLGYIIEPVWCYW